MGRVTIARLVAPFVLALSACTPAEHRAPPKISSMKDRIERGVEDTIDLTVAIQRPGHFPAREAHARVHLVGKNGTPLSPLEFSPTTDSKGMVSLGPTPTSGASARVEILMNGGRILVGLCPIEIKDYGRAITRRDEYTLRPQISCELQEDELVEYKPVVVAVPSYGSGAVSLDSRPTK